MYQTELICYVWQYIACKVIHGFVVDILLIEPKSPYYVLFWLDDFFNILFPFYMYFPIPIAIRVSMCMNMIYIMLYIIYVFYLKNITVITNALDLLRLLK